MEWYEAEVRDIEQRISAGLFPPRPIVFYGSSSIRLWDTLSHDLGPEVVNLGFGGSTLEACAHFFRRVVEPVQPSSLFVYAGDNDLGDGRSPEHVLESFRRLAVQTGRLTDTISRSFISIKPSPARWDITDRIRRTNDYIAADIARRRDWRFINVFNAMLNATGHPEASLYEPDGLHLSRAGYRLWAKLLAPYTNEIFLQAYSQCNKTSLSSGQCEPRVPQMVQPEPES